jgi:hypothetical protein
VTKPQSGLAILLMRFELQLLLMGVCLPKMEGAILQTHSGQTQEQ